MNVYLFSQPILKIHYHRLNGDYENWKLWIWNKTDNKNGFEIDFIGKDNFGVYAELNLAENNLINKEIGILPKYKNWEKKEAFDRFFVLNEKKEIFIVEGDEKVYESLPDVSTKAVSAFLDDFENIRVIFNRKINQEYIKSKKIFLKCEDFDYIPFSSQILNGNYSDVVLFNFKDLKIPVPLINNGKCFFYFDREKVMLKAGDILYSKNFYSDLPMGVIFNENKTIFRVFSPNSMAINLILKDENKTEKFPMMYKENGIWEYKTEKPVEGKCYLYEVIYADKILEGIDPYAKCVISDNKCAYISKDKTFVSPGSQYRLSELIIYEMSIRDFTIDENSGVKEKGKYLGLTEKDTFLENFPQIKTGLSHLKELGVNAVQIMPFFDFEKDENSNDYNWGYMPVNFNSPEGWFAKNKTKDGRVKELKKMISALHQEGLKVIMDVVYNHTAETKNKIYNFNALVFDYYYRKKRNGEYYNGSGCGNEFKSEAPMARKFIIDSLKYWIEEYKIDGFRFDLMGLIDKETVLLILDELKRIKPDIIIYGEPWKAGESEVEGVYKGFQKAKGFAVFNDNFRDAIKGNVFNIEDLGYVQSGNYREKVMKGIKGSIEDFTFSPLETINYVSCHDNHTLWDRIDLFVKNEKMEDKIKMDKLAQAIVFVSQGIPFLHSGEEFLRTKKGEDNSYNLPDEINKIDWKRKKEFFEVFKFYRDLIKLRKEHPAFRMDSAEKINKNLKFYEELGIPIKGPQIAFTIDGKDLNDSWNKILVLINPEKISTEFILPEGKWKLAFDENGFVSDEKIFKGSIKVNSISLYVLYQALED